MVDPVPAPVTPANPPRRSRLAMGFFGIVVVVLIVEGGACIAGSRELASMTAGTGAKVAEVRARNAQRPALRGTTTEGSAWEHYQKADGVFSKDSDDTLTLERYLYGDEKTTKATADAILAKYEAQLVHLRTGAACRDAQYPYTWERGAAVDIPRMVPSRYFAAVAAAKARHLAADGRGREAAELLLDVMQYGADFCRNSMLISSMIGVATVGNTADELAALLKSDRLGKDDFAAVAAQLELLDAGFPSTELALRNEAVLLRVTFLEQEISLTGGAGYPGLVHPRYFFIPSLVRTDAVRRCESMLARLADAASKPWSELVPVSDAVLKESLDSPNPIVRIAMPGLQEAERAHRERHAQLRLLRMAALARAGAAVPDLDDPFGAKLRHAKDGAKRRFWSVGKDGADNGGVGSWRPSDKGALDIVLELEEK